MITRVSSVIRPKGSDLIFDHPYNAEYPVMSRCAAAIWSIKDYQREVPVGAKNTDRRHSAIR